MSKKLNALRPQLILAFLVVILVTLCGVSVTLLLILRTNPLNERLVLLELGAQGQGIATSLRRVPAAEREAFLTDLAARETLRLGWATADGTINFDTEQRWQGRQLKSLSTLLRLRAGNRWLGDVRDGTQRWLVAALPWPNAQEIQGYLLVAILPPRLAVWQRFRTTMMTPLLEAGGLAFLVGILLALWISRSIARPLQQVAGAAQALTAGDLAARAPVAGPEEVQSLARTFNTMAQRVQDSQQAQRALVANITHDLRTPLTSIQGFAQALVEGAAASPQAQVQAAQAIYEESQRMRRMVEALLELARFDAGQVTLDLRPVELAALAQKRVAVCRPRAGEAGIALAVETAGAPVIAGDLIRLEQVLDNLLDNALKHTPAGGKVTVTTQAAPPWGELIVTDTGGGIPPEELPRIFERFYRADKARGGQGMGLGLAIVQEIVRAHGGDIRAESVVGLGSRFTVRLPLRRP